MKLEIRHVGRVGNASQFIEMTVKTDELEYTEDITDSKGKVDENLIDSLREILEALQLQNERLTSND